MTTRIFVGVCIAALLPLAVSAATVEELQVQIANLINKISALQGQLGASSGASATPILSGTVQCPQVSRVLRRGATGADVSRLQQFLALDPSVYPDAQMTGYYGALTEKAVQRFQCKNKLVCDGTPDSTGYGVAGPRTAALLALQCPDVSGTGSNNVGGFIKVTPISGNAPLTATIDAIVNTTKSCIGANYEVDYGDNTPKTLISVPANNCSEMRQVLNHTYTSPGTFVIMLRSGTQQTYATVTVGGNVSLPPVAVVDTFAVTPQSGTVPFTVTFRGTINSGSTCNNNYTLDFGNGQTAPLTPSGCVASTYSVTHVYTTAGTFVARLIRESGNVQMGNVTITANGAPADTNTGTGTTPYGSFFSVTPGAGGNVFSVLAEFEIVSPCTAYRLNWGDGSAQVTQAQSSCTNGTVSKQFEHTYASAGSYTVVLNRGANLSETHSAGITISD